MYIVRLSKALCVLAIALFASLVAFGNMTDFNTNYQFVEHVFSMDTIFPNATIKYRAITSPMLHHVGYITIIAAETITALLCWIGGIKLLVGLRYSSKQFHLAKKWAVVGLTLGFLTWQVAFMSIGGEWFGMWMSKTWNGVPDAFRFFMTILVVLIYVVLNDTEVEK